ncbi:MAG TPA: hypothetical protein VHJ82_04875 [Actinomycetota bacterium]|nr:hypothetical protein [Actinomycetota bacterium]
MEADIKGLQRKVVASGVRPLRSIHGDTGIPLSGGRTLPWRVWRRWNAPAGYYTEAWYLIDPQTREVLAERERPAVHIWGLQSLTELVDDVTEPLALLPGSYTIVFALGGVRGGELSVATAEVAAAGAA